MDIDSSLRIASTYYTLVPGRGRSPDAEVLHLACDGAWVLSERLDTHVEGDRRMPLPVMNISRVVDGKLALWRDYYDMQMVKRPRSHLGFRTGDVVDTSAVGHVVVPTRSSRPRTIQASVRRTR
jgi:Limonene-1,2-epoxide hydrolase catalytic domain